MKADLRPTTPEDVASFIKEPLPYRIRAITGTVDGEIKGIGGLAYLPDGTAVAFLEMAEGAERYKVTLHRAALRVIEEAKARGVRKIVAQADLTRDTAERWLDRLGFAPVEVDGERVWIWQH